MKIHDEINKNNLGEKSFAGARWPIEENVPKKSEIAFRILCCYSDITQSCFKRRLKINNIQGRS